MKKYTIPQIRIIEMHNEAILAGSIEEPGSKQIKIDINKQPVTAVPWDEAAVPKHTSDIWDNDN